MVRRRRTVVHVSAGTSGEPVTGRPAAATGCRGARDREFSLDEAQSLANYVAWMDVVEDDLYDTASYVSNVVCGDEGYRC